MALRIPLNFASESFQRNRPILVASIAVGVGMTGTLALLIMLAVMEHNRAADTRQMIAQLDNQLIKISQEQTATAARLRRRENAEVLERNQFLNMLLYRKGISWTRIFSDLEGVLPHNVRLISVRPQISPRNELVLDMVVGAQANEPVIDMLKRLETSPLFGSIEPHNSLPPSQSEPLYRYRVSVNYAQKL